MFQEVLHWLELLESLGAVAGAPLAVGDGGGAVARNFSSQSRQSVNSQPVPRPPPPLGCKLGLVRATMATATADNNRAYGDWDVMDGVLKDLAGKTRIIPSTPAVTSGGEIRFGSGPGERSGTAREVEVARRLYEYMYE